MPDQSQKEKSRIPKSILTLETSVPNPRRNIAEKSVLHPKAPPSNFDQLT